MPKPLAVMLGALALAVASPAVAKAKQKKHKDRRLHVLDAMTAEMERSMKKLQLPKFETPYFINYTIRDYDSVEVFAKFGAIYENDRNDSRQAYVEVRVGDYQFDNTADDATAGEWNPSADELYEPGVTLPVEDDLDALRGSLWLLTDTRYKAALAALNQKRGRRATTVIEDETVASFTAAKAVVHTDKAQPLVIDRNAWAKRLRTASAIFKKHTDIFDSDLRLSVVRETRYLVTSEGSRIITERTIYGLHLDAVARADDGAVLYHSRSFYGGDEKELPSDSDLATQVERLAKELGELRRAPVLDPYTGPAILMEEATGVLFHEVIGHRLEGERQGDEAEGQTFKGQIGRQVIPTFLDVVDDPTKRKHGKISLNGWYRYDDEGVPSEAVTLIDNGVLKTYLTSRRPVSGVDRSNGHGRAEGAVDPMARMGITVVRSDKQVKYEKLKQMLLEEARKQGKPFGLIIRDISGGSTNTASTGYQAFNGTPRLMYKVDAKSGEETLVRGAEMVGTPLTSINKILATSDTVGVFNGYCGAESGYVPVSTMAPAVLLSEIELQRAQSVKQKATVLPPPWKD